MKSTVHILTKKQYLKTPRGVTKAGKGAQFPGRRITIGALNDCGERRKVPTMSQVLSSTQ